METAYALEFLKGTSTVTVAESLEEFRKKMKKVFDALAGRCERASYLPDLRGRQEARRLCPGALKPDDPAAGSGRLVLMRITHCGLLSESGRSV
jgi:hypothetical protein